MFVYVS